MNNITLDECFQFGLGAFETIGIEKGTPILSSPSQSKSIITTMISVSVITKHSSLRILYFLCQQKRPSALEGLNLIPAGQILHPTAM